MDTTPFSLPPLAGTHRLREAPAQGTVKDLPETLRPRELLLQRGRSALSDDQLLAILLRSGVRGCNVLELARRLLHQFGSLAELTKASPEELLSLRLPGLSTVKALELCATLEIAQRVAANPRPAVPLQAPERVVELLQPLVAGLDRELFLALPLDRKNRLKGRPVRISEGTVDASLVHPREVYRECVRVSAAGVIVAHNHPSGDATPSVEDLRVTRQLVSAGQVLGIPLLDHVVLGNPEVRAPGYVSLRADGLVNFAP